MVTHSFTCKQAIRAFTPQPQSMTALWLVLILPCYGGYKAESTYRWLVTFRNNMPPPEVEPDTVTHPSTNRAQRRLTSLIETNALPPRKTAS